MGLGVILAAMAAAQAGGPVYLACEFKRAEGNLAFDVAVDEANQQATIGLPSGRTVTRRALFSPSEVKVPDEESMWLINRTDLSIRRKLSFMPPDYAGEVGACTIKPAPAKRAF